MNEKHQSANDLALETAPLTPIKGGIGPARGKFIDKLTSSLFVLPYLICFIAFLVYPLISGIVMSFQDYDMLSSVHKFVGFQNYIDIFSKGNYTHTSFFQGLTGTAKFVIFSVPFLIIIGL